MSNLSSISAVHDRLAGNQLGVATVTPLSFTTGVQTYDSLNPFQGSFTANASERYNLVAKAGTFIADGSGLLFLFTVSENQPTDADAYPADVFDSRSNPDIISGFRRDTVIGTVDLVAGTTYFYSVGGLNGTRGQGCVDITPI